MTNAIEEAIKEAVKGGWSDGTHIVQVEPKWGIRLLAKSGYAQWEFKFSDIWIDPLFWQSLGRAQGWEMNKIHMCVGCGVALRWNENPTMDGKHGGTNGCGSDILEYDGQGMIEHHRFIDHLWERKDAESFFRDLLTPSKEK